MANYIYKKINNSKNVTNKNIENINFYGDKHFPFSEREARLRGTLVTGMPQSGKTNLVKMLADYLMNKGYNIKVLDPSQAWLESTVPYFVELDDFLDLYTIPTTLDKSVVYDISRLYPDEQKIFIGIIIDADFNLLANMDLDFNNPFEWVIYIIEEAQMVIPSGSLRAKYSQQTFRMVSVGRNFNQRYFLVTQRPADVSVKAISRAGQCYFGQHWEENDIMKISRFLGNISNSTPTPSRNKFNMTRELLSSLKIGEFVYLNPYQKIQQKIETPLFEYTKEQIDLREIIQPKKPKGFWEKLYNKWINWK